MSKPRIPRKPCQVCGRPFPLRVEWKKYCSPECRLLAWADRRRKRLLASAGLLLLLASSSSPAFAESRHGTASWFSTEACRSNPDPRCPTASGRSLPALIREGVPYAAAWGYPFGTVLKVCVPQVSRCTRVVILDRGPSRNLNRLIDLNPRSFAALAPLSAGVIPVEITEVR